MVWFALSSLSASVSVSISQGFGYGLLFIYKKNFERERWRSGRSAESRECTHAQAQKPPAESPLFFQKKSRRQHKDSELKVERSKI